MKVYFGQVERQSLVPINELNRPSSCSFSSIDTLIGLAELNYKLHKKYRTIGLLCDI